MSLPKKPISEINAAAAVMDGIFDMVDERWDQVWPALEALISETGQPLPKSEFARFNFALAILSVNFRAAFDLLPRGAAERIFTTMLQLLETQLGPGPAFAAVKNAILKYVEAFNTGILAIRSPLQDVSMLYYYKIGLKNIRLQVVDEPYFIPDPKTVDYLGRAMTMFVGRWEMLLERFQIVSNDHDRNKPPGES